MKKVFVFALLAALTVGTLGSCKKVISNLFKGIDVDIPAFNVTIPALGPPIPLNFELPLGASDPQPFNLDSIIKANTAGAFGANDVTSVKIKRIVFALKNADANNNLANFQSVKFGISSNTNSTPIDVASFSFSGYLFRNPNLHSSCRHSGIKKLFNR